MGKADQGYQSRVAMVKIAERKERLKAYDPEQAEKDLNMILDADADVQI